METTPIKRESILEEPVTTIKRESILEEPVTAIKRGSILKEPVTAVKLSDLNAEFERLRRDCSLFPEGHAAMYDPLPEHPLREAFEKILPGWHDQIFLKDLPKILPRPPSPLPYPTPEESTLR